jgi:hypothetical protein
VRLLQRLRAETAAVEVGELAVVLEQVVRPDALHDLDRLAHVLVPLREDVRGARRGELLGHPPRPHTDVDPTVREVVMVAIPQRDAGRANGVVMPADPPGSSEPGAAPPGHSPRDDTGRAFGNSSIMPNEYWSS